MITTHVRLRFAAATLGLLIITACCPAGRIMLGDPQNPYPLASPPKVGDIVHLPTGKLVDFGQMISVAGDARIVYLGETHDNPASHRLELEVLRALSGRHPGKVALGMEMFVRSQQAALDDWVAGNLSEKEFLRESRWFENWSIDFAYYRDLLTFARERKIPLVALNAEKKLVNEMRNKPLNQVNAEGESIPALDGDDPYQRAMTAAYFGGHTHGQADLDGFVRVQTLWDETMAESVANYLSTPGGKDMHMMVVAGGNHINYGFGIPRRVFRRLPLSYILIGGKEIEITGSKEKRMMNVDLPAFPMPPYEFLAYITFDELKDKSPRLGVMIEPDTARGGLLVREVTPDSNAARAGLAKGDLLVNLDGMPLKDNLDLIYALKEKKPGDHLLLKISRDGKEIGVDVAIRPATANNGKK